MIRPIQSALLLVLALSALVFAPPPAHAAERPLVFAAASTQPVMDAVKSVLSDRGIDIAISTGGSSTLARQIQLGAGADVFVSANVKWMDYLDQRGLLEPGTRRTVATNRLAVIAGPGAASQASLTAALGDGRLALADPAHVPAGLYAREALETLGLWDRVKDRLAPTKDVTGALMLVARGEAPVGIVYTSDTRRIDGIDVIEVLPATSHAPIQYQAAIIKGHATAGAAQVLETLSGPDGQQAFSAAGFGGAAP